MKAINYDLLEVALKLPMTACKPPDIKHLNKRGWVRTIIPKHLRGYKSRRTAIKFGNFGAKSIFGYSAFRTKI